MLDQRRGDAQLQGPARELREGEQLDGVAELARVGDVGRLEPVDALAGDLAGGDRGPEGELGEHGQLVRRVGPVDVERRVGLGEPEPLRLPERDGVRETLLRHLREDIIARPVDDRRERRHLVRREADPERLDDRDSAADARLERHGPPVFPRLGEHLATVLGQERLVGRDDVLPRGQGSEHQAQGGVGPADRLDDDPDLGVVDDAAGVVDDLDAVEPSAADLPQVPDGGPLEPDPFPRATRDQVGPLAQQSRDPRADRPHAEQPDRDPFHPVPRPSRRILQRRTLHG